jgi:hypothetical protein
MQADIDELTDAEERNSRVRASVSRLINLVQDYESEESVDDGLLNLFIVAEENDGTILLSPRELLRRGLQWLEINCLVTGDRYVVATI